MEFKSTLLDFENKVLEASQNTKFASFCADSLFFKYMDDFIFTFIALTIICSVFAETSIIGIFAVIVILLTVLKVFFVKGERLSISSMDMWIVVFYMFVVLSLFASSLFILSLKGFLKMFVYAAYYFSLAHYFLKNKFRILPLIGIIAALVSLESIIGIVQNFSNVLEISGWQDTSNLDVTEVISRCYGTLKPYNPNLLAGYLIVAMPSLIALIGYGALNKNRKLAFFSLLFLLLSITAVIYTGCRGAYLAIFALIATVVAGLFAYLKHYPDGLILIKKRYKAITAVFFAAFCALILSTPSILKRIISIFAAREDSSISFRLNVYEAAMRMFLDNPIFGIGVGNQNFREIYGLYMKTGFDALGSYSVLLEIAVESGVFALIAFCGFLYIAFKKCIDIFRNNYELKDKILVFSIFLVLTGSMVHGFFDTIFFRPQLQVLFWLNIAILNTYFFKNTEAQ